MSYQPKAQQRHLSMLSTSFGESLMALFDDNDVIEIMLNPTGDVFVERLSNGKQLVDITVPTSQAENIIKLIATLKNQVVTDESPMVSSELPFKGARFQGWLPPVVSTPSFAIRKRANRIFTLDDYVAQGALTKTMRKQLKIAVSSRMNIVVSGGTGSGKTTFANALLHELHDSDDRVIVLEDLPELQTNMPDVVSMVTTPTVSMRDIVKGCLRMRPDRIVIGEVRDGAALELLKAWNTGHPGGLCTIHANSIDSTPFRFEDLILEAVLNVSPKLITEAIDLIVFITRDKAGSHKVEAIKALALTDGAYHFTDII